MGFEAMGTDVGVELGWDDTIEKDAAEFILLPEGDYDFVVAAFERVRFAGSEKVPACNQAKLRLEITTPQGVASINHNLFLYSKYEGMLSAFFAAIGQKKKGEKLKMDWGRVIGAKGRAKISTREYDGKTYNQVKRFHLPDDTPTQPATNFKAGSF